MYNAMQTMDQQLVFEVLVAHVDHPRSYPEHLSAKSVELL
jgi:hypothetical protein